jgi:hypothetical protein
MKLSDYLLTQAVGTDIDQNRRLSELESMARSGAGAWSRTEEMLRTVIRDQAKQIRHLAGALNVVSATVDLLGELLVEKGVVDEAGFYDRLIDVVTAAQARQEREDHRTAEEEVLVTCVWCGRKVPKRETVRIATGHACAPCHRQNDG